MPSPWRTSQGCPRLPETLLATCMSQKLLFETKETLTGKKSLGWPATLNSRLPVLFLTSMTGKHHSRMFRRLSWRYSPSRSTDHWRSNP
uniref:Uncharacterized protein n=1 Tax=Anguilla anguilla TaxID=7936 RepID=A0A0E9TTC3_ANGAN